MRYNDDMYKRFFAYLSMLVIWLAAAFPVSAAQNVGGSKQTAAQAGCMNKWMFNGMWRVRVTKVALVPAVDGGKPSHYDVTMQWGNGTSMDIEPSSTRTKVPILVLKDGSTILASDSYGDGVLDKLTYRDFPASAQFTYTQPFVQGDPPLSADNPAVKLLIEWDNIPQFRKDHPDSKMWSQKTAGYNYRIDLTCGGTLTAPTPVTPAPVASP